MIFKARFWVILVFICVMLAPVFAPHDPGKTRLEDKLLSPLSAGHILGTEADGRDILSLVLHGARVSLVISMSVVGVCLFVGFFAGLEAAYRGGIADRIFLFVADVFQAFPGILLAMAMAAFLPPSVLNLVMLLAFTGWVGYARLVRAQVLELRSRDYITAARALGVEKLSIILRYLLPNLAGPLIVQASFGMAGAILAESTLSFLGIGLPAGVPSLGKILDGGVTLMLRAPHVALIPGFVIMLFVLAFNFIGDRLRVKITGR